MGNDITKVLNGIYLSRADHVQNDEVLIAHSITHILFIQGIKLDLEQSANLEYLQLVINERDSQCLFRHIRPANQFIHSARVSSGNVLVCSESGVSSNVAILAAYLMTLYSLDFHSALDALQSFKPGAVPIACLQRQLEQFGCSLRSGPCSAEVERAVLLDNFGPWDRLEEDLIILEEAAQAHRLIVASDFPPLMNQLSDMEREELANLESNLNPETVHDQRPLPSAPPASPDRSHHMVMDPEDQMEMPLVQNIVSEFGELSMNPLPYEHGDCLPVDVGDEDVFPFDDDPVFDPDGTFAHNIGPTNELLLSDLNQGVVDDSDSDDQFSGSIPIRKPCVRPGLVQSYRHVLPSNNNYVYHCARSASSTDRGGGFRNDPGT